MLFQNVKRIHRGVLAVITLLFFNIFDIFAATPNKPLMGWASWNVFNHDINEAKIKAQADAMVSTGLAEAGYRYINIDDGFWDNRNPDGSLRINSTLFPSGFKALVDYIHAKGLKAGFYSDGGDWTCGAVHGGKKTGEGVGLYQHEQQDIDLAFKTWNFDYIKVDYCGGSRHLHLDEQTQYTKIKNALGATGRDDIVYNVCRWQFPGAWVCSIGNSWRIADDINASWGSITGILDLSTYLSGFSSPGHYNDMDMLEVGHGLPQTEDESHYSLWCIMSSPLVLGNDLTKMSAATLNLLKNSEAIAVNQDTSGLQARLISDDGNGGQVWARRLNHLSSNERAVVLFNRSASSRTIKVSWKDIDLSGSATVRDILKKKDLGAFETELSGSVPSHGVLFVRITGSKSLLQEVFEAENAMMNNFNLTVNNQIVANQAKPVKDVNCSGGAKVSYVGKSVSNFLEFNKIWAENAGRYSLTLRYLSGENRSVTVNVNGKDSLLSNLNSGAFTKVDSIIVPVYLKAGVNVIRFSNSSANTPDIDAISINLNAGITDVTQQGIGVQKTEDLNVSIKNDVITIRNNGIVPELNIYNLAGKLMTGSSGNKISLRSLEPGTYILNVDSPYFRVTRQFVKK